ncbi:hypothetical protein BRADI_4g14742v3 [Brachypodium distachyon]|uniref:Uncharacterized protein n=1 Tax=Brachypodium distachyon TaxID=15368 RepID=A0A0Q3INY9_BRADI|nr:hypothetical protein BRADI_4g14742v3 [Brachypodium distachyon]
MPWASPRLPGSASPPAAASSHTALIVMAWDLQGLGTRMVILYLQLAPDAGLTPTCSQGLLAAGGCLHRTLKLDGPQRWLYPSGQFKSRLC